MTVPEGLTLAVAGLLAGALNAVGGGGSFVALPALFGLGLPAVEAIAASTVALLPPGQAAAWAYRKQLRRFEGVGFAPLIVFSAIGGLVGAILLRITPSQYFEAMLPWLVLIATLTFAFGRQWGTALRRHVRVGTRGLLLMQVLLGVYTGYFGGGVGILMMACWSLFTSHEHNELNATRMLMVTTANLGAAALFIVADLVPWPETLALLVGGLLGSYAGAATFKRLAVHQVRRVIVIIGALITLMLFAKPFSGA